EVYLELIGGRQPDFALSAATPGSKTGSAEPAWRARPRPSPLPPRLTADEAAAHAAMVAKLGESGIWKRYEP
ncbi:MAG: DNA polymerase III subunit epsilon, partial [Pararhodobacter sp.]